MPKFIARFVQETLSVPEHDIPTEHSMNEEYGHLKTPTRGHFSKVLWFPTKMYGKNAIIFRIPGAIFRSIFHSHSDKNNGFLKFVSHLYDYSCSRYFTFWSVHKIGQHDRGVRAMLTPTFLACQSKFSPYFPNGLLKISGRRATLSEF